MVVVIHLPLPYPHIFPPPFSPCSVHPGDWLAWASFSCLLLPGMGAQHGSTWRCSCSPAWKLSEPPPFWIFMEALLHRHGWLTHWLLATDSTSVNWPVEITGERLEGSRREQLAYSISPAPVGWPVSHGLSPGSPTPLQLAEGGTSSPPIAGPRKLNIPCWFL